MNKVEIIEEAKSMLGDMIDKYLDHLPQDLAYPNESIEINAAYEVLCGLEVVDLYTDDELYHLCKEVADE